MGAIVVVSKILNDRKNAREKMTDFHRLQIRQVKITANFAKYDRYSSHQEMKRYKISKIVGDGTFGSVVRAVNTETGEVVCC